MFAILDEHVEREVWSALEVEEDLGVGEGGEEVGFAGVGGPGDEEEVAAEDGRVVSGF